MSAFLVSTKHIDALVTAGMDRFHVGNPSELGTRLVAENTRSINSRYRESTVAEPYIFRTYAETLTPVETLKAVDCYEYQSCEHTAWLKSDALAFCKKLSADILRKMRLTEDTDRSHILGYDEAEWGI